MQLSTYEVRAECSTRHRLLGTNSDKPDQRESGCLPKLEVFAERGLRSIHELEASRLSPCQVMPDGDGAFLSLL